MTATLSDLDQRLTTVERKAIKHDEEMRLFSGMIIDTNARVRGLVHRMDHVDLSLGLIAQALDVEIPEREPQEPEIDDQFDPELVD